MHVALKRSMFLPALRKVTSVTSTTAIKEVLQHLLISADESGEYGLAMCGTDMELSMIVRTDADVLGTGAIVVPAKAFLSIVELAGEDISLEQVEDRIRVLTDNTEYSLPCLAPALCPDVPHISEVAQPVDSNGLQRALEVCLPAAGTDETRPSMLMIHFEADGAFATDGTRAHHAHFDNPLDGMDLPIGAVRPLLDVLKSSPDPYVYIDRSETHIIFLVGKVEYTTRVLDAAFPSVRGSMLTPRRVSHTVRLSISKPRLEVALRRAASISDDVTGVVSFQLFEPNKASLMASSAKGPKVVSTLDVDWTGAKRTLHFSVQALLDVVKVLKEDNVTIRLSPSVTDGSALISTSEIDAVVLSRVSTR